MTIWFRSTRRSMMWLAMKPAPPVTTMRAPLIMNGSFRWCSKGALALPARQHALQDVREPEEGRRVEEKPGDEERRGSRLPADRAVEQLERILADSEPARGAGAG